ncbi:hypothetical protein NDU88_002513 [Pleurodeles waltl]|uniref:Uncharacterized protein n=1 Tax=Pleurodeles waltl TaxID=8319 RepID=A0AAV7KVX7_PLEWA|nr:hypothetical protein NDU88_002513 [Pleurodeles waltl]
METRNREGSAACRLPWRTTMAGTDRLPAGRNLAVSAARLQLLRRSHNLAGRPPQEQWSDRHNHGVPTTTVRLAVSRQPDS